ncbi:MULTISPECIES: hypothetical protein [Hyphobacterium]|uniref:Alginate export domain-containing protein n=1 Tax=Hyphobacterium vulgare TaxID=1736751 RepID=A0ABV6ZU39_9PROT
MSSAPALAGAWPLDKGEGLIITTALLDRATSWYDDASDRRDGGDYRKLESAVFFEYGLTGRFTLVGRVAWQDVTRIDAGLVDSASGFASSEAGLRYAALRRGGAVLSVQGVVLLPGEAENIADLPLGEGGPGGELRMLAGYSASRNGFLDAQLAYRWRETPDPDEVRLDLTAGWRPRPQLLLMAQSFSTWSTGDIVPGRRDFAQHKLQVSAAWEFETGTLQAGLIATPAGRNAIAEEAVLVSWWRRF